MNLLEDITKINIGSLNFFDLTVLAIIGISVLFGLYRGFVRSAISFAGWGIAFVLAIKFSHSFLYVFEKYTSSASMASVASACTLFLLFALVLAIINSFIIIVLEPVCGGIIDRAIGLFFGLVRGLCLVSIIFYFMIIISPSLNVRDRSEVFDNNSKLPNWAQKTESLLLLTKGANIVESYIPDHFKSELKQSIDESIDGNGNFSSPIGKAEKIQHINHLLNILPEEVLSKVAQNDILTLQDNDSPYRDKIRILETIADIYQKYNGHKTHTDASKAELQRLNKEHYYVLSQIEEEIQKYNRLMNDGED